MRSLYKTTLAVLLCICLPLTLIALPLSGSLHAAPAKKILSTQSKSKAGAPVRPATKAAKQPLAPQAVKSAGTGNKRVGAGNKTAQTPSVRSQSKTAPQPVRTAAVQKNKDSAKEEAARKAASAKARQETALVGPLVLRVVLGAVDYRADVAGNVGKVRVQAAAVFVR